MSTSYDVALVMDAKTLNKGINQLYASADSDKIFKGTQQVGTIVTSVDWSFGAAPSITLAPPDKKTYTDPKTFFPSGKNHPAEPTPDMFQIKVTKLSTKINLKEGSPITVTIAPTVFAEVKIDSGKLALGTVGVYPGDVPAVAQLYIEILMGLVYDQVNKLVSGYKIPSSISAESLTFDAPVFTISGGKLAVASNLSGGTAVDISGATWPDQDLAVLVSRAVLNKLVDKYSKEIVKKMDSAKVDHSGSNWTGSYSVKGGITDASISLSSTLPDIDVDATASATVEIDVSWWLVPGACAIEAASNLIAT